MEDPAFVQVRTFSKNMFDRLIIIIIIIIIYHDFLPTPRESCQVR